MVTFENRSERPKTGSRSAVVRLYDEHRRPGIGARSRFAKVTKC
jgi:hypothetical protein